MSEELKPCPFCNGNRASISDYEGSAMHVRCQDCGVQVWGHKAHFGSAAEACRVWNTRALSPTPDSSGEGEPAGWISVEDRLPALNQSVALIHADRLENTGGDLEMNVRACGYLSDMGHCTYWSIRGERATTLESFTHWTPLPAAPGATRPTPPAQQLGEAPHPVGSAPCRHEAYQGRCVHCDAPFVNGVAANLAHTDNAPFGFTSKEKSAWSFGFEEGRAAFPTGASSDLAALVNASGYWDRAEQGEAVIEYIERLAAVPQSQPPAPACKRCGGSGWVMLGYGESAGADECPVCSEEPLATDATLTDAYAEGRKDEREEWLTATGWSTPPALASEPPAATQAVSESKMNPWALYIGEGDSGPIVQRFGKSDGRKHYLFTAEQIATSTAGDETADMKRIIAEQSERDAEPEKPTPGEIAARAFALGTKFAAHPKPATPSEVVAPFPDDHESLDFSKPPATAEPAVAGQAEAKCALCGSKARIPPTCDACHDSMGTKPKPAAHEGERARIEAHFGMTEEQARAAQSPQQPAKAMQEVSDDDADKVIMEHIHKISNLGEGHPVEKLHYYRDLVKAGAILALRSGASAQPAEGSKP